MYPTNIMRVMTHHNPPSELRGQPVHLAWVMERPFRLRRVIVTAHVKASRWERFFLFVRLYRVVTVLRERAQRRALERVCVEDVTVGNVSAFHDGVPGVPATVLMASKWYTPMTANTMEEIRVVLDGHCAHLVSVAIVGTERDEEPPTPDAEEVDALFGAKA